MKRLIVTLAILAGAGAVAWAVARLLDNVAHPYGQPREDEDDEVAVEPQAGTLGSASL